MGAIATAFTNTFVDASNVTKSNCRSLGTTIEAYFVAPWTFNKNVTAAPTSAPSGYIERLIGLDADTYQMGVIDAFGGIPALRLRRANGTGASPTAVASGNSIGEVEASGWYVTGGPAYPSTFAGSMRFEATENWSSTAQGTRVVFKTTPNTTAAAADAVWIEQNKSLLAGGAIGNQTGVGAGGTVTQATNRTTGVTLNTVTGEIVVISATYSTTAQFLVTNSFVGANDVVVICQKTGSNLYFPIASVTSGGGSFSVYSSTAAGTATESYKLQFTVIKGAIS
jgi:hypothetical protein